MHTVELLEQALSAAEHAGFSVRQDWFGTGRGGNCQIKGQRWIFLDLSQSPLEQLDTVLEALGTVEEPHSVPMPPMLASVVARRYAA